MPTSRIEAISPTDKTPSLLPINHGEGRIRPRARLLKTIGAELISSEVVAVIELVRNSYDADATLVDIVFKNEDQEHAVIEIRDNGHGMTQEILLGPWMEPATDHKTGSTRSGTGGENSALGRRRLGSKGVGRFATQRLGSMLELRTRPVLQDTELSAEFDWDAIEDVRYLDEVRIPWQELPAKHVAKHGTHLVITRLRDKWTPERFDRLKLGLSRLVSPGMREEFKLRIHINGASEDIRSSIESTTPMYSINGTVDAEGIAIVSYKDFNGDTESWERSLTWHKDPEKRCGPFSFRISAWDLDKDALQAFFSKTKSKLGLREFRRAVREHSGVSLYRDGFRILPYGEPDNDWLRLDQRRVNNPTLRLSNNQILGVVQLQADENSNLQDQTNREGLVSNEAYNHLVEVMRSLLSLLEAKRFAVRRSGSASPQKRTSSLPRLANSTKADEIENLIDSLAGTEANRSETANQLRAEIQGYKAASADAVRYYSGLASVGQMSGLVFRQLAHPMRQMRSDLALLLGDLEDGRVQHDELDDFEESVRMALSHLATMEKRMATLNPLAVGGRGRRVSDHRLSELLLDVTEPFAEECIERGVTLYVQPKSSKSVRTNKEIAQQVLAGLLDNAVHFATMGDAASPIVTVATTESGFTVSDNGIGIPEENSQAIFEPHFTTREAPGLGLTLVCDLLRTVGGSIRLTSNKPATFEVQL